MLTKNDLKQIEEIVTDKTRFLPTKDDFYGKMDEVMGEVKGVREVITLMSGRVSEHSDQLEDHAKQMGRIQKHFQTSG